MIRKVQPWYSKRCVPSHEFNKQVVLVRDKAHFHQILEFYLAWRAQFLDDQGELKPRFQPPPMVASFMQEPGVARRETIPVPKGPVEVWCGVLKQKFWSWGDDFRIQDAEGRDVFFVDGLAFSWGDKLSFQDMQRRELA